MRRKPGKPIKRYAKLKRHARIRTKRSRPRRGRVIDKPYLAWLHTHSCACDGRGCEATVVQAHHTIKGNDASAIPLSPWCHLEGWHGRVGGRKGWLGAKTTEERNEWGREQVRHYRALWLQRVAA